MVSGVAQKLSDLTQAVAVLLTRTFLMEGKQHAGDRWQHLSSSVPSSMAEVPGKKSNYADALRREQNSGGLSTLTSAGRFFCLVDGEPA